MARAIKSVGEQLVDLIPKIYGNRDRIKVVNLNGDVSIVGLNSNQDEPVIEGVDERGQPIKSYNLSLGKYGVRVEVGPYNLTKRQEAVETMGNILQTNPELWKIAGDLFVKNMDWPGARELSDRLLKTIPPEILDVSNPQLKGAQLKIEELTNQMAQMQGIIAKFGESLQVREVEVKEFSERVDAYNAETNRLKVELDHLREMKLQSHKSDDKIEDMEDDDE